MQLTPEQREVVNAKTTDLLVAAAAGSGKTSVLVERILRMITDPADPVDIDRILIVTFTNDAAAQMRDRIRDAIDARLASEPDNERLLRQSERLNFASIQTIDSFCQSTVKRYFHSLNIDPNFRILEASEGSLLWQQAMEDTIEAYLSKEPADVVFFRMMDMYSGAKDDAAVRELVDKLSRFAASDPEPDRWLLDAAASINAIRTEEDLFRSPFAESLCETLRAVFASHLKTLLRILSLCELPDGPDYYAAAISRDCSFAQQLSEAEDLSVMFRLLAEWKEDNAIGRKKNGKDEDLRVRVKDARDSIADNWKKKCAKYLALSGEAMLEDIKNCAPAIGKLCELTIACRKAFRASMDEKNAYDFSEIEHMTLELLLKREGDRLVPTEAALQYRKQFHEIMVDEYQDSNLVQERFLRAVSTSDEGRPNMFMVGDVKQSIYKFRMARPELFMEKLATYRTGDGEPERLILLNRNFRSRKTILDGVNHIFRKIMQKSVGSVAYDASAELQYGATHAVAYSPELARSELLLARKDVTEDTQAVLVAAIAKRIRELTDPVTGLQIETKNGKRTAGFGDIAVVARKSTKIVYPLIDGLLAAGIPAYSASLKGYFESTEVNHVLCFLKLLDNPFADIPCAAVLLSPLGGFTEEDLAQLVVYAREEAKAGDGRTDELFGTLKRLAAAEFVPESCAGIRVKCERFLSLYNRIREQVGYLSVPELLTSLYRETGYLSYVSVQPAGRIRERNLLTLVEKAKEFASGVFTELSDFVRYIDDMIRYDVEPDADCADTGNAVRVMTIHKSKGLEYPIVFLVDTEGQMYHGGDSKEVLSLHSDLGIGPMSFRPETRRKAKTLAKTAIEEQCKIDECGEALRLLYVAMTRARDKLILTGTCSAKEWGKYILNPASADEPFDTGRILSAGTYLDLIIPAILADIPEEERNRTLPINDIWTSVDELHSGEWSVRFLSETPDPAKQDGTGPKEKKPVNPEDLEVLRKYFAFRYPYNRENMPVKLSVSALKMSAMEEFAEVQDCPGVLIEHEEEPVPPIPAFLKTEEPEGNPGALRGTLYHRILELHDYSRPGTVEDSRAEAEELVLAGRAPKELLQAVSFAKLSAFYASDIGTRMKQAAQAGKLKREQAFVMSVPADSIAPEYDPSETILVQGIIDAMFLEGDEFVLLDYKTDRVPEGDDGTFLVNRYKTQLRYYADAIRRGTEKNVKDIYIYSFALQKSIRL